MANGDFNPSPQDGESREQYEYRFQEAILGQDWRLRFQLAGAEFRALDAKLAGEAGPDKIIALSQQRRTSLTRVLGSDALSLWKNNILAEREEFEVNFGQSDQS